MADIKLNGKKIALLSIFTALALILFVVENLFPPLIIPGAKMGLSNVFILLAILYCGNIYGVIVFLAKVLLGSLITGNISSLLYSLPAGIISITIEILLIEFALKKVSIIAISTVCAVLHNVVQKTVFCLISKTSEFFVYLPYLSLLGVLAGFIVGFAVWLITKLLYDKIFS